MSGCGNVSLQAVRAHLGRPAEAAKDSLGVLAASEADENVTELENGGRDIVPAWIQGPLKVRGVLSREEGFDDLRRRSERVGRGEPDERGEARERCGRERRVVCLQAGAGELSFALPRSKEPELTLLARSQAANTPLQPGFCLT